MRPVLLRAFGLQAMSAPVFAGLAALLAFLYMNSRRRALALEDDDFWTLIACLAFGSIAGSIVFYAFAYGGGWASNLAFWRRNAGIQGGSFIGGLLGAFGAAWLFCRARGKSFAAVGDALGAAAPLGLVVMRFGCLLNGCCHGSPTALPWGLVFTGPCAVPERLRGTPLHPTQLLESAGALAVFAVVHRVARRRPGMGLWTSLGLYGALRFAVDFLREGDPGVVAPLGLTSAQWLGATAAAAAAVAWMRRKA